VENLASLFQSGFLQDTPEAVLALPYLEQISAVGFSGVWPEKGSGKTKWRIDVEDYRGRKQGLDLEADLKKRPIDLSVSLSSFWVDLNQATGFLPESLHIPSTTGECHVLKLSGMGPLGKWEDWSLEGKALLELPQGEIPGVGCEFERLRLDLDAKGKAFAWQGSASVTAARLELEQFEEPILGLTARDLEFSANLETGSFQANGPWSVEKALGTAFSGKAHYQSQGPFQLHAETKSLDPQVFSLNVEGTWAAALDLEGNLAKEDPPHFEAAFTSKDFRYGRYDFSSRLVHLKLDGTFPASGPSIQTADLKWGDALHAGMEQLAWNGSRLDIGKTTFTGDLVVLSEFLPSLEVNPRFGKWVHPRDWSISGGISLTFQPDISIRIPKGEIDSGRGIKGPVFFEYSGADSSWSFRSPTLRFDIHELLQELDLSRYDIDGVFFASLDLHGKLPKPGAPKGIGITSGILNGEIKDSNGQGAGLLGAIDKEPPWFGWKDLNGDFQVTWGPDNSRIQSSLAAGQWFFFTRATALSSAQFPPALSAPARLNLLMVRKRKDPWDLQNFLLLLGESSPIEIKARGTLEEKNGAWVPDLRVQGEGNGSPMTPVFRGIRIGGTGVLTGKITGNEIGNWVFDGNLECSGVRFEQVTVPLVLENVRNTFYLRDVRLDEIASGTRWKKRRHTFPPDPDQPDSLARAFEQSRGTDAILAIEQARVGESRYMDISARAIIIGEVLHLNTIEGRIADGEYSFQSTGFAFLVPGLGSGWRILGQTGRVPLAIAVPGLFKRVGLSDEALEVTYYLTRTPPKDPVQTRFLRLGFPIGKIKDIPALGPLLFGWTPDSLGSQFLIVQKVGQGDWGLVNPFKLPAGSELPRFLFDEMPKGLIQGLEHGSKGFLHSGWEEIKDFINPGP
jgi:hypothetical protein